ncbi:MAG TPA: DUF4041 domain-containing protein [Candidatus Avoscillospira stercorigallinarum]|uniref:DUF4041 domain-containing protein n=1 Tax=Candidatus Avoscillospira stercorigallinarum TaxID=2840708 RepID=A0A9D0Z514_9FIRM|nr:DUF4041 domain-containing protein [Candidatus Avoscillospira stercorigallinarum]
MEGVILVIIICAVVALISGLAKISDLSKELKEKEELLNGIANIDAYAKIKADEMNKQVEASEDKINKIIADGEARADSLDNEIKRLEAKRQSLEQEVTKLEGEVLVETVRIDAYLDMKSEDLKNKIAVLRSKEDEMIKNGEAVKITMPSREKKFLNNQSKQILRCFNSEVTALLSSVTFKNVDSVRTKISRSYETANKIFADDGVQITHEYVSAKLEELSLIYAQIVKEEEEREQRKAIREQMVEEEKVRREIEREKAKIDKETTQFSNEVKKLMGYLQKSSNDVERQLYVDKISELEAKIKSLEKDKENVLQREQNTRAGFVYIISNIGSFGEGVYKIGMTRRLDPMERISELSSASVPFVFDVHALIFSDDAPALEACLHQTFRDHQVNRVNSKKEFFRVDLDQIKEIVKENHNATVQFIDIPEAAEYRETLRIEAAEVEKVSTP